MLFGPGGGIDAITDFLPSDLPALELWLDSSDLSQVDGSDVTLWTDKSGNGHDAAEATSPPTFKEGSGVIGPPSVLFDTTSERLEVPASAALSNASLTYVVIFKLDRINVKQSGSESRWVFNKLNTNPATLGLRLGLDGYQALYRNEGSEGTVNIFRDTAFVDQAVQMQVLRGDTSQVKHERVSGFRPGAELINSDTRAVGFDDDNHGKLILGNHPSVDNTTNVDLRVFEVMVFTDFLSDAEIANLESYFRKKYPPEWTFVEQVLPGSVKRSVNISIHDGTAYLVYGDSTDNTFRYATADVANAPHVWTDQGLLFDAANLGRSGRLLKSGSTWHLYYDDRVSGDLRLATGATLGALTYTGSPVLSGTGSDWEEFIRHPYVLGPSETHDGLWHMLYDGREGTVTSGDGGVGHATSTDGLTWTRDAANPVIVRSGIANFDAFDAGEASAFWNGTEYEVFWSGYRLQSDDGGYPHHIGYGTSPDLSTISKRGADHILALSGVAAEFDSVAHVSPAPYLVPGERTNLYFTGFGPTGSPDHYLARAKRVR